MRSGKREDINYLKSARQTLSFAITPYRGKFIWMWVIVIIANALAGSLPYFFKLITDTVTQSGGNVAFHSLFLPLIAIPAVLLVTELGFRVGHILEVYIATDAFRHITTSLYQGLIKRPTSYFEDKFSGDLGRRVEQIGTATIYFIESFPWQICWVALSVIMAAVLLGFTNIYVLLTFLVFLVLFVATSAPLLHWHHRESQKLATAHAGLSGSVIDALGNIPLVHSFGGIGYEEGLNRNITNELIVVERRVRWITVYNKIQQGVSIALMATSLTAVSVLLFTRGQFTVGDFVVVVAIIPSLIGVIWNAGDMILQASRHFGQLADAVHRLKDQQEQLSEGAVNEVPKRRYTIEFSDVRFQYAGTSKPVFDGFSFRIEQGEHVGIVGSSGAGKSTLIKLLLRQQALQEGIIAIGGISIDQFTLQAFSELISYVPQDTSLFHRTLLDNIRYANPSATQDAVLDASKRAHAHEFITALPQGYETMVGERGVKLSGGQRQRIALARAILKDAPILVLDEATSSLDSESEAVAQQALADLFKQRTVIAIAHRLSTLRAMDRIIVMESGRIIEDGNPQELLDKKGAFKQMWEHQKNGFI